MFSVVSHLFFLKYLFFQLSTHLHFLGRCANALPYLLCSYTKGRQDHHIVCIVSALACYTVLGNHTESHTSWHNIFYPCWSLWSYRLRRWRPSNPDLPEWEETHGNSLLLSLLLPSASNTAFDKVEYSYERYWRGRKSTVMIAGKKKKKQKKVQVLQK